MLNNEIIADNFSLLAKLMEVNGENPFKIRSYANVVRTIEKYPKELSEIPHEELFQIKGIGDAIGKKIIEQLETGKLSLLEKYNMDTPPGILEMLLIKGIGTKKVITIWKELGIETLGELLYACEENRLLKYKGFGEKTQQSIKETIEFYLKNQGLLLYAEAEPIYEQIQTKLDDFKENQFLIAGAYREQQEIIAQLTWITDSPKDQLLQIGNTLNWEYISENNNIYQFETIEKFKLEFIVVSSNELTQTRFLHTGSDSFIAAWKDAYPDFSTEENVDESTIFQQYGLNYIPAFRRESTNIIAKAKTENLENIIQTNDIKGIIHCHSVWSDGANSIVEMANAAKAINMEYIAMSDHSQSAFYANGLTPERITAQHEEIDQINKSQQTIPIFKSIESDILYDGKLDYEAETLAKFDIVIASVHSILKMDIAKATSRVIAAVENPYTSILGHMTGRLLLTRAGYPIDHKAVIDACAANNVVIELNAHPRRLDIDWEWIEYALDKNITISINSDAHSTEGLKVLKYGVLVAQKAGLTADKNLSSYSLDQFKSFMEIQKSKRPQ